MQLLLNCLVTAFFNVFIFLRCLYISLHMQDAYMCRNTVYSANYTCIIIFSTVYF